LPHGPDGAPLRALLAYLFRLSDQNILDEQKLLAGRAPQADFVFREDGWDEAKALDQLGQALRRELRLPVRLSIPQIDRPHVVVSGHYVPARLPGTEIELPVVIYGKEPPAGVPEREVDADGFLRALGDYVGLPVIDANHPPAKAADRGGFPGAPPRRTGSGSTTGVV